MVKVTLPSMVTKPPMSRVRSDSETSKTLPPPAGVAKVMSTVRPPSSMDSLTAAPVEFIRTSTRPPACTPPAAAVIVPLR